MATLAHTTHDTCQEDVHFDRIVDARGLSCPLPHFSTRKSVESLLQGEVLKVLATDKGSVSFFESLVRQTGLELIFWQETNGEYQFYIRKNW